MSKALEFVRQGAIAGQCRDGFRVNAKLLTRRVIDAALHLASNSNKNKRQHTMHIHAKVRQAGMIMFATAVVLILPNLSRLIS